ncbi:hypothetical protein [Streptomyces sp. NBC_00503]|uniref:hypothetical protein n=1 Tax=Streptomyces sp. NBC_00503 TaxID=2903659 RepID=UPI002E8142C8|nr:hypothetical protein [Streptomyces sp. NBC_00503]WUD82511.1 hypothetical protein OG490_19295 [Streptomyces sp. NBC_00503]
MALSRALRVPLTVLCVVLLCVFGTGRGLSPASAEGPRSTSSAPAEPTESPADPAGDPEVRLAARVSERDIPGVRGLQRPVFHVKHAVGSADAASHRTGTAAPTASLLPVRSVVLRC